MKEGFSLEKSPPAENITRPDEQKEEQKTEIGADKNWLEKMQEKISDYKRAIALTAALGSFGAGLEAAKPSEVYAELNKEEEKIEAVIKKTELKELKKFTSKDGYFVKYINGVSVLEIDGKEYNVNLTNIEVQDAGDPNIKGDEKFYQAKFTNSDKKEMIESVTFFTTPGKVNNPYEGQLDLLLEKFKEIKNQSLVKEHFRSDLNEILSRTIILKALGEAGKKSSAEYKVYQEALGRAVEEAKQKYGDDSVREEAFKEIMSQASS
ncbi:MAG: hypothetical protein AAB772_03200 [Patescibacteria group bacterium]